MPRETKTAVELDVTEHRSDLVWRRGETTRVKRRIRRRERHDARQQLRREDGRP
jgi:hypothetical protein